MPITINILGSCVSRDVFGLFPNDGGFDIKQYVAIQALSQYVHLQLQMKK